MKIGILTYHNVRNYGAVLQAFALKKWLETKGNEVKIIHYSSKIFSKKTRSLKAQIVSFFWNRIRNVIGGKKKNIAFNQFRKNFLEIDGKVMTSHDELREYSKKMQFDSLIVGSDQVWNSDINGKDAAFFLNFAEKERKISYAASFGVSEIAKENEGFIKENISRFDAISVREKTGSEILKKIGIEKEVSVTLDPVFLLGEEDWSSVAAKRLVSGKYILCYVMPGDKALEQKITTTASQLSRELEAKVIYVGRKEYYRFKNDGKDMVSASPQEFISLIKHADAVVTNSFHGTAFSVIFKKKFYSFTNSNLSGKKQLGSRINDLLLLLGLEERLNRDKGDMDCQGDVDFSEAFKKLEELKNKSKTYLIKEIGAETKR